jgi:hypothetical protein
MRLNLQGNTFTHTGGGNKGYSVHAKKSDLIEWVQDRSGEGTVFVDAAITLNSNFPSPRYAWLYESKHIKGKPTADVLARPDEYFNHFDYVFAHDQNILSLHDRAVFVPANGSWIQQPDLYEKTQLVSMISSTKNFTQGHKTRIQWVNRLRSDLHLYGRGFKDIGMKEEGLCDYMFSVAIENGEYPSYFTEKILDCFATGTIPVYLGTPDIGEFFNPDGIITLTDDFSVSDLTADYYYDRMPAIKDNLQRVIDMGIPEDYIYRNYLS